MLWLKYLKYTEKTDIRHCFNNKEKKIGPYPVDGYDALTDTVYEFQGCWMHGCPKCFSKNTFNALKCQSMGHLHKMCEIRSDYIKEKVNNFIEIWEHDWDERVKKEIDLIKFCEKC